MKFALGTKQEMTQVFTEDGLAHAATILRVEPMVVTQVKAADKEGYSAVQVGTGAQKKERLNKAQREVAPYKHVKEFRVEEGSYKVGDTVALTLEPGDVVTVASTSKGKGFQGVVKRHGFHGGPRTHGQKHSEREPGSIGSTGPQRVFKGMRMAGRMGGERVTVRNLKVLQVDASSGTLLVSGAIPGRRDTLVEIVSV